MQRRKFSREFKFEAIRLVRERGVSVAQAARDLDLHANVLRKWMKECSTDPQYAFPGHGQLKPEQLVFDNLFGRRFAAQMFRSHLRSLLIVTRSKHSLNHNIILVT